MDESLKQDFDAVCNELGMSMTTAITILAKKMTREKTAPVRSVHGPVLQCLEHGGSERQH